MKLYAALIALLLGSTAPMLVGSTELETAQQSTQQSLSPQERLSLALHTQEPLSGGVVLCFINMWLQLPIAIQQEAPAKLKAFEESLALIENKLSADELNVPFNRFADILYAYFKAVESSSINELVGIASKISSQYNTPIDKAIDYMQETADLATIGLSGAEDGYDPLNLCITISPAIKINLTCSIDLDMTLGQVIKLSQGFLALGQEAETIVKGIHGTISDNDVDRITTITNDIIRLMKESHTRQAENEALDNASYDVKQSS